MPRRPKVAATPKKVKQGNLDAFVSSSPPHRSSPARPPKPCRGRRQVPLEDADDDDIAGPPHIPAHGDEDGSQSSDAGAIRFEPKVVVISSSEDEGDFPPRPTFSGKGKKRAKRAHSEDSASAAFSAGDEDREVYVRKGKQAAKKTAAAVLDSDEEEEIRPPKKRKLVKGQRPPTPEEDEADLMDEVDERRIIDSRLRTRDKRTAFQKNLEKLKRKKRGEAMKSESDEEEKEGEEETAPFTGARPDKRAEDSDGEEEVEEQEDDTFIVEDDSAQAIDLPAEFSMGTYQDLLHHFKIVCQFFVHIVVHDPDDREDASEKLQENQYFSVPLKIARRKLSGMRDSLVAGSTWKPHFRKALDTYPIFETQHLDFTVPRCDACNLGGRKSTIQGRLSGEPYDPQTYETIGEDEPSSDDEEGSGDVKKEFDLGRFCAKRTRTYHQFTHWEYHLFHALRDEVESLKANRDERSFVRVAYAKGKQPPEDLSDADAIMDWLDERQVINIQWQEIKTMMDNARHLEVRGGRGDDVDSD